MLPPSLAQAVDLDVLGLQRVGKRRRQWVVGRSGFFFALACAAVL